MEQTAKNKLDYFHVAVMMVLTFAIGFLPPFGQITVEGMKVLGVFIGLIYGWCFIGLFWPSLFGFFAIALSGVSSVLELLSTAFSNTTVVLLIILSGFAGCLNRLGVSQILAYWIMSKKIFLGRPWLLAGGMIFSVMLLGLMGTSYAAIFLFWSIIDEILKANNIENGNLFSSIIYALVVVGVITSGGSVPYLPGFLIWGGFLNGAIALEPAAGMFFILGVLHVSISLFACLLIAKYILRVDGSKFIMTEDMRKRFESIKANKIQKIGLVLLLAFFIVVLVPSFMPAGELKTFLNLFGVPGFAILYMIFFAILKDETGKPACDLVRAYKDNLGFEMIALIAITIPLGNLMSGGDIGISATLGAYCIHLFEDFNVYAMVVLTVLVLGLVTQVMHNLVLGAIFLPILIPMGMAMGLNPYTYFFVLRIAFVTAYMTPAASLNAGMIFGRGDIPTKHSILIGFILYLVMNGVALALIPLCNIMFAGVV